MKFIVTGILELETDLDLDLEWKIRILEHFSKNTEKWKIGKPNRLWMRFAYLFFFKLFLSLKYSVAFQVADRKINEMRFKWESEKFHRNGNLFRGGGELLRDFCAFFIFLNFSMHDFYLLKIFFFFSIQGIELSTLRLKSKHVLHPTVHHPKWSFFSINVW